MNLSNLIARADSLFRKHLLTKWGTPYRIQCTYCKTHFLPEQIEVGHIFSRKHYIIRWHLKNATPLCRSCNQEHDGDEIFLTSLPGEDLQELIDLKNDSTFRLTENFILEAIEPYE